MAKIIAISSPKGGVGKTTVTINLAASLAIAEMKVLLMDFDPMGAISLGLGLKDEDVKYGLYEFIRGTADITQTIHHFNLPPFDFMPCNVHQNGRENRLFELISNRGVLKQKLHSLIEYKKIDYDFIIIDTPPVANDYMWSALSIAHSVILPLQCGYYSLKIIERMFETIDRIKTGLNPHLSIEGVLLNFYDARTKESQRTEKEAKQLFGDLLFKTRIPRSTVIGFSAFEHLPVIMYDAFSKGANAYLSLAKEILTLNGYFGDVGNFQESLQNAS